MDSFIYISIHPSVQASVHLSNHFRVSKYGVRISVDFKEMTEDIVGHSQDMDMKGWTNIALKIKENYCNYHGFVILHGTDTLCYTASALSFMFENLAKSVILTGSLVC